MRFRKAGVPPAPGPHDCEAARRVAAACRMLGQLAAGGSQMVLIGKVLAVLDPGQRHVPAPLPGADPVTGAMWAGPPGSSPPA